MLEYRIVMTAEISNIDLSFTPTSVFLNGIQTFAYKVQNNIIYFDNTLTVGTELVLTPPEAVRSLNDAITTVTVAETGKRSVCAMPFGALEFSSDTFTWVKSFVGVFPATIYCRPTPHDTVLDCTCKVDIDIVVWDGGANASLDENGEVAIIETEIGGIEYELY